MTEAVTWAEKAGLDPFFRPHPAQLKYGPVNFWPNTGKVHVDGEARRPGLGLDAFKVAVMERHAKPSILPDCEHLRRGGCVR